MISRTSLRQAKTSKATPQNCVTVSLNKSMDKKKFYNHHQSILRELIITQNAVQNTLNKTIKNKSKFKMNKRTLRFDKTRRELLKKQTQISMVIQQKQNKGLMLNQKLKQKFMQIGNISKHFQKVCQNKEDHYSTKYTPFQSLDITFPINKHLDTPDRFACKQKDDLIEMKNNIREWKQKVKQGRRHIKNRQSFYPNIKTLRLKTKPDQQETTQEQEILSYTNLRDAYFQPIQQQRKTVPIYANTIQDLLLEKRQKKKILNYHDRFQRQPSGMLKQFIQGGQPSSYRQFSNHLSISGFQDSKDRFNTLSKMYNYIKEHNMYEMKDMNIDSFNSSSMISLVYFIEKSGNLSQVEKRAFKKKLQLID